MKRIIECISNYGNIPKHISNHLCGENHSIAHRRTVGVFVILLGVVVAKCGGEFFIVHIVFDAFGYALHGIGLIPFIESMEKR